MMMKIKREGEDMDYLVHNIAINLNHIRKAKGMSLDVVAEQTGVSKSMLAAIEKGAANPSIGSTVGTDSFIDIPVWMRKK